MIKKLVSLQVKEIDLLDYLWTKILNISPSLLFTVANVELITVKDVCLFTIVPFVNWNCVVKIDELRSVFQIYFTS